MAVSDVFTAITEDRPYRKAMPKDEALQVLQEMARDSLLDSNIVSILRTNFDEVNSIRMTTQKIAFKKYQEFWRQ
jgi:HD-GYP domain-containing protein (c-di-GMP phosphodiesterase class II)